MKPFDARDERRTMHVKSTCLGRLQTYRCLEIGHANFLFCHICKILWGLKNIKMLLFSCPTFECFMPFSSQLRWRGVKSKGSYHLCLFSYLCYSFSITNKRERRTANDPNSKRWATITQHPFVNMFLLAASDQFPKLGKEKMRACAHLPNTSPS